MNKLAEAIDTRDEIRLRKLEELYVTHFSEAEKKLLAVDVEELVLSHMKGQMDLLQLAGQRLKGVAKD